MREKASQGIKLTHNGSVFVRSVCVRYGEKRYNVHRNAMIVQPEVMSYSIYVHFPFCRKRCSYCDFNTFAGLENHIPEYIRALLQEIQSVSTSAAGSLPVHTIFFGGGTPSLVPIHGLQEVIKALYHHFRICQGIEISLEANPGTLSLNYLQDLRSLGVNRLSLGVQSAHNDELTLLGRIHDRIDVIQSVRWGRGTGFEDISLDLLYGIPGQTLRKWRESLDFAINLHPDHLSLYALTLENDVPMQRWIKEGALPAQDEDLMADMYELASNRLTEAGFAQYEISNWAARDPSTGRLKTCQHNLQYWHNQPYLGLGAGAHGFAGNVRTENVHAVMDYINRCQHLEAGKFPIGPAIDNVLQIDRRLEMQETMMVGLRLTSEGVARKHFKQRFGCDMEEVFGDEIASLLGQGLLEYAGDGRESLRLTSRGRFLGNLVFMQFVGE
jgi:oxygen-independent coproporphyrinogen-3 oxidase